MRVHVIFITFLLLGEEENTLIGQYLSLYLEAEKSHSVIPETTSHVLTSRVNLDCQFDCIDDASRDLGRCTIENTL